MKKLLIFFLSIFLFTAVYGQEAIFKNVRSADSIRSLLENTKAGGAPVNIELKNTEGSATLRLDENGDFTIDGGNYVNIPMLQNSLVGVYYNLKTNDYIEFADHNDIDWGVNDFALPIRFRPDKVTGTQYLINKESGGVGYGIYLVDDDVYIRFDDGTTDASGIILTGKIVADNWYTLTISFDRDGNATAYLNGNTITGSVDISSANLTISNAGNLRLGCTTAGTDFFDGGLALWLPYNCIISSSKAAEIALWDSDNPPFWFADVGASNTATYTSDFSVGVDGIAVQRGTGSGNNDAVSDGVTSKDDCYKFYANADNNTHYFYKNDWVYEINKNNIMRFWYYIPAGQTHVDGFDITNGLVWAGSVTVGTWTYFESDVFNASSIRIDIRLTDGGITSFIGANNANDDRIFIKDITFIQIGCNGNCNESGMSDLTWYDNSGNGLDGTNNGATLIRNPHTVLNTLTLDNSGDIRSGSDSAVDAGTLHAYIASIIPSGVESGTADGQFLFWDTDIWKHTENSELVWDDVNKRLGVGTVTPSEKLEINGNIKADNLGLVLITENAQTGWRLYGMDAANYGDIGDGSVDISFSETVGSYGATGWAANTLGYETEAPGDTGANANGFGAIASGDNGANANGQYTIASGSNGANSNGNYTIASGANGSNANGKHTKASGEASSASGIGYNDSNCPEAAGNCSFVHQEVENGQGIKKAVGNNSAILGGKNNEITAAGINSIILGGVGVTLSDPNTARAPHLQIDSTGTIGKSALVANAGDSLVSAKEVNAAIEAATGAIVYSTAYSATNYTVLAADEVVIFTDTGAAKDTCWLPDLYSGKGVWIRRGDNTNDVVITANDLTTDGSTNITNYNMTGTVNSVFCVQESTQWNIVQIGN